MTYDIINQHVKIFGSIFKDILIKYYDEHHEPVKELIVPISYTGKDKLIQVAEVRGPDPDNIRDVFQTTMPRMSFEMTNMQYNGSQKLNRLHSYNFYANNNVLELSDVPISELADNTADFHSTNYSNYTFTPTPYKIFFNLYLLCNREIQSQQILEQILPKFTPDLKIPVIYDLGDNNKLQLDESLSLLQISKQDLFNEDFEKISRTIHTLSFSMDCKFFKSLEEYRLIKVINFNFGITDSNDEVVESTTFYSIPLEADIPINLDRWFDYFYNDLYHDTENLETSDILYV